MHWIIVRIFPPRVFLNFARPRFKESIVVIARRKRIFAHCRCDEGKSILWRTPRDSVSYLADRRAIFSVARSSVTMDPIPMVCWENKAARWRIRPAKLEAVCRANCGESCEIKLRYRGNVYRSRERERERERERGEVPPNPLVWALVNYKYTGDNCCLTTALAFQRFPPPPPPLSSASW